MSPRPFVLLAALVALAAAPAAAQDRGTSVHLGTGWGEVGAGYGTAGLSCNICTGRSHGVSGEFAYGFGLSPGLQMGAQLGLYFAGRDGGRHERVGRLGAVLRWKPRPSGALVFRTGLGYYQYRNTGPNESGDQHIKLGTVALTLGVGYGGHLSRTLTFTPYADVIAGLGADLKQGNDVLASPSPTLLQAGIALGFR